MSLLWWEKASDRALQKCLIHPRSYYGGISRIKEKSDVVICITTGGSVLMTVEERAPTLPIFKPEMFSFNLGSINFALHTSLPAIKQFRFPWEKQYLEMSKDYISENTFKDFKYLCAVTKENQTRPGVLFGKENFTWSLIGVGAAEINLSTMSIHMGGHVRVGLEDNIYIKRGVLAKSNAELVEKVVHLAEALNRQVESRDGARAISGLKGRDKANY